MWAMLLHDCGPKRRTRAAKRPVIAVERDRGGAVGLAAARVQPGAARASSAAASTRVSFLPISWDGPPYDWIRAVGSARRAWSWVMVMGRHVEGG